MATKNQRVMDTLTSRSKSEFVDNLKILPHKMLINFKYKNTTME